jgi:hypothetical protein
MFYSSVILKGAETSIGLGFLADVMTWSIARLEHRDDDKEDVNAWGNGETYTLREVIPALTRGGYHGAKQIASYMMKHYGLEKGEERWRLIIMCPILSVRALR